ncbi:hypothetical protein [Aneurinibacillus migulanus]|uniref:Uncharacterized protein n=1 Tax=Aneurinibacillus migulanus TaxID=47500 RepID=A0A0D1VDM8_ANEMI|nr:hypothetical protein [Aneurinibacillus migulanus]KIV57529.1 hypothetical protein TS65_09935 [Aneurinibacillus migulanus]KON94852.1 hypothetical protein AF333_04490 [Aneurinibacillus migulanus]MED0892885.1 hypothetical protein [Aneurinibacillus migulanus]MED1619131.1 hypothetical protein [Aneurinibacillus migulanus]SDI91557.1 hypothetical protein SAMN04487909_10977 [Aneurinibacillus migulanus]
MTEQELKEIRERLEAATPGPWEASGSPYGINVYTLDGITICEKDEATRADFMNADFIAKSSTDIRRLLDEVEHLKHSISCATCAECADQVGDKWELFNHSIYCSNCINYVKEVYNDK